MSSCSECHGSEGLHRTDGCPRITGARLYTPKQLKAHTTNTQKELLGRLIDGLPIERQKDNVSGKDYHNGYNACLREILATLNEELERLK